MLLEIQYQNNVSRRINLHPSFFAPIDYSKNKHIPESTTSKRAIDIAYALDVNPIGLVLSCDGEVILKKTLMLIIDTLEEKKTNSKILKKELRRELKNKQLHRVSFEEINTAE